MNQFDAAGHIAYFFIALGMFYLARQQKIGWAFRFAGELGWFTIGILMGMTSIWMWGLLFLYIDVKGYFTWRESERRLRRQKEDDFRTTSET